MKNVRRGANLKNAVINWYTFSALGEFSYYFAPAMTRWLLYSISFWLLIQTAAAQSLDYRECSEDITLSMQARLDSMAAANFEANRIQGYRILLYTGNDRNLANLAKENAYQLFPKGDVYLSYQAPTFKVRFGNFYSRLEAWQNLLKFRNLFPNAVITNEIVIIKP